MKGPLDKLPLDVLFALLDSATDPSAAGRERAEARARDAGYYLRCLGAPAEGVTEPIAAVEATPAELSRSRAEGQRSPIILLDFEGAPPVESVHPPTVIEA